MVVAVILTATVDSVVEQEIAASGDAQLSGLRGLPKALLPVGGKPMLDHWMEILSKERSVTHVYLVTSAAKYKFFERWATAHGLVRHLPPRRRSGATGCNHAQGAGGCLAHAASRARSAPRPFTHTACYPRGERWRQP